jgi:2-polyprenyl-3-methyl-5-hydroxy-6-metoxy-1,4-benzoquinol methylase
LDNVSVAAPEKWMDGWDKIYKQMLDAPDEEMIKIEVSRPVQQLVHALYVSQSDFNSLSVLELASGDGSVACYLGQMGARVKGVEALASAVGVAERRVELLGLKDKVEFSIADMDGWSMGPEQYDVVIAIQCLQYLFDRTIPRLRDALTAIKPGGFFVYSGNILPHFDTDPPLQFVTQEHLEKELEGWTLHCIGSDTCIIKPNDTRGYVWVVARKPF